MATRSGGWPDSDQFKTGQLKVFRQDLLLLSAVKEGLLEVVWAGQNIEKLYGFNPEGLNYLDFVDPARRVEARNNMRRIIDQGCGLHSIAFQHFPDGRLLESEAVGLPLSGGVADLVFFKRLLRDLSAVQESPYAVERNEPRTITFFDL